MNMLKEITFRIENCEMNDINVILSIYENARTLQTQKGMVVWPVFEREFVEREIKESRQWKLVIDDTIACNWAITFDDKDIWGDREKNDAIYIHRIATDPAFRGNRFVDKIVEWAKQYAPQMEKQFIRLDTLGNNTGLIKHYTSAGFKFLGMFELADTSNLPGHYQKEPNCCLFEMDLEEAKKSEVSEGRMDTR